MISATLISLLLLAFTNISNGQTKEDATNAYNRGVELASSDLPKAIEALIQAADVASKATDAADIQKMAEDQIPLLQYNYATSLYKEKKLAESIDNFILAYDYAVKYNDNSTRAKASDLLPKLYLSKGNSEMNDGELDKAIASAEKAISYDSTYAKAYLIKGLALNKQGKADDMKVALDKAIMLGKATNDEKTVATAGKILVNGYVNDANAAFQAGNFSEVVSLTSEAIKYADDNADAYYLAALANNKLSNWDDAISAAEKGLTVEENTAAKLSRFYFELGMAQAGKNDTGAACASFKKAAIGPLAESANYQINTVLKCN